MKWIFPCNPNNYDIENAFVEMESIDWTTGRYNLEVGDLVYVYVSAPVKAIKYQYVVTKTDKLRTTINDEKYGGDPAGISGRFAEFKRVFQFPDPGITLDDMRNCGYEGSIQGPTKMTEELEQLVSYWEIGAFLGNEEYTEEDTDEELISINKTALVRYMDAFRECLTDGGISLTPLRWNKYYKTHG